MCQAEVDLEQNNDVAGYLSVRLDWNGSGSLGKKQEGLIDHAIQALELDVSTVNKKANPAEAKPLIKDEGCR